MFSKRKSIISLALILILIGLMFFNIFFSDFFYQNTSISSSIAATDTFESSIYSVESVLSYKTQDDIYSKDFYWNNAKNYDDVIVKYNPREDSNYLTDTVFIGDSNTAGLASFNYLPLQNVLAKKSMAIGSANNKEFIWFSGHDSPLTIVDAVGVLKPRRIIINFGTNNTIGHTPKDFKNQYKNVLLAIKKSYPYADIIVSAILPVGISRENHKITMQTIDNFNLALLELCNEDGYRFLNTCEIFKEESTGFMKRDYVAPDGVHLNSSGYKALLKYVNDHKYITRDPRPPRGFIPRQLSKQPPPEATPEYAQEPGEEAIMPPPQQSSEITLDSIQSSELESLAPEVSSDISQDTSNIDEEIIFDPFQ